MKASIIAWLLQAPPWVRYHTLIDLLGYYGNNDQVIQSRTEMVRHPYVRALLEELTQWPGTVLNSHKSASQPFHKLSFLADLGIKNEDPCVNQIVERVCSHASGEGLFTLPMKISESYGGSGDERWAWALCDAPVIVYALNRMGYHDHPQAEKAVRYLSELVRENGWPCAVSKELGKFRGPGKKDDSCPYATLVMLKMLSELPDYKNGKEAHIGTNALLSLWGQSREEHPYMFYMGTDFRKLKAPFMKCFPISPGFTMISDSRKW